MADSALLGMNPAAPLSGTDKFYLDQGEDTQASIAQIHQYIESTGPEANTEVPAIGAATLTGGAIVSGVITRSGGTAPYSDTTDTAANIVAALSDAIVGQSWHLLIKNTAGFTETLLAGSGVTLAGQTIIPPNSAGLFLVTYIGTGAITVRGLAMVPLSTSMPEVATALTTVGAGTITAAGMVGGVLTRGGAQSGTSFTDTTDTAANIIAAQPNASIGQSWEWTYRNNTDADATLSGGAGVAVLSLVIIPKGCWARYLVTYPSAGTVTITGIAGGANAQLPSAKYTKNPTPGATTAAAGDLTGANVVQAEYSAIGTANLMTRTAAQMFADISNCQAGFSYVLEIMNTSGGTITLVGGTNVTLVGTMTMAANTTRRFNVMFTSATACTIQNMGTGTV